ncbi:type III restriction-modification system restriction subunit Res [Parapedobacter defluvii]|uniref:Type III restriction-modification system restriction subunit Res n=1 Tax=Parapedobacter defluvii TaxID=2045106 RepID=A0ABQ1MM92_9SPHI|nr:DEAD/DEAH box helicase [Parapedobacter defluvii]GGC42934.1 type III restriction-modification system restriction subunit Res [Parapedobacter defluvii]
MELGIYEQLITTMLRSRLAVLDDRKYYISETEIDKEESARLLAQHLSWAIQRALTMIKADVTKQIEIANQIVLLLKAEIDKYEHEQDLVDASGQVLKAVFDRLNSHYPNLDLRLKEIMPYTRLTHSELFTGGNVGLALDSELKKEIASADRVDLLVSFIKWKAVVILREAFRDLTARGGQLRILTTTYMGATDAKAIRELAGLPNTTVKVSYNTANERLHAKAYLFYRNTGFHTGYIGSSNFSRSALTDGLEWNVKVTTREIPHVIDKFQKTFETYWQSAEFEIYDPEASHERLARALKQSGAAKSGDNAISFFDIKPYHYQQEVLEKLDVERSRHGRFRNLVVAATGTGKTIISAFDFKRYRQVLPNATFLFTAHRKEILMHARNTFRNILRDQNFGELWVDGEEPTDRRHVFASVQTLNSRLPYEDMAPAYYDYIVFDEVHHVEAASYKRVIDFFTPNILLGLTATPERMDGQSILPNFCNHIAAEIRLPEALNNKLLTPFHYFAIADQVDLTHVRWDKGRYATQELTGLYIKNKSRVGAIIASLEQYTRDMHDVIALGFCVSKEHAAFMCNSFNEAGLKAAYLTSDSSREVRGDIQRKLRTKEINYLFIVDIFNEGVDIPEVDTVLFLRPTESLTVFLQQLGRGLRLWDGKDVLTVLDFVGNARPEYDFESKFRALIGKTNTTVQKEIQDDFPHLPLGCAIVLEKVAKETILANIRQATNLSRRNLIAKIQAFRHHTNLPLTLANFLYMYSMDVRAVYARDLWSRLCYEAGVISAWDDHNGKLYLAMIRNKWSGTASDAYFSFVLELAERGFAMQKREFTESERAMLLMLYYDFYPEPTGVGLLESIEAIGANKLLVKELIAYLRYRLDGLDFREMDITTLGYEQPLKLHARYTRDQILAAFGLSTVDKKSTNREGVAENKGLNTELLFIDLQKSEEDYSPTTLYDDYAINDVLFHWQSQNRTRADSDKGLSYINQEKLNKNILLFVRETKRDEWGNTLGYVFLGDARFVKYEGEKPMSITWELREPIPSYLWNASAKMAVG